MEREIKREKEAEKREGSGRIRKKGFLKGRKSGKKELIGRIRKKEKKLSGSI